MSSSHSSSDGRAHEHGSGDNTTLRTSAQATAHCLAGCLIGEIAGLAIGISFGLGVIVTIAIATGLAYITGFALALIPLMGQYGLSLTGALGVIWLGEAVSIAAMEVAMNGADWLAGGLAVQSLAEPRFWIGLMVAVPAGFLAAWPVNHWLLKRQLKTH